MNFNSILKMGNFSPIQNGKYIPNCSMNFNTIKNGKFI